MCTDNSEEHAASNIRIEEDRRSPAFERNLLSPSPGILKMEIACSSETSAHIRHTIRRQMAEYNTLSIIIFLANL
jgi:hypothetical protein